MSQNINAALERAKAGQATAEDIRLLKNFMAHARAGGMAETGVVTGSSDPSLDDEPMNFSSFCDQNVVHGIVPQAIADVGFNFSPFFPKTLEIPAFIVPDGRIKMIRWGSLARRVNVDADVFAETFEMANSLVAQHHSLTIAPGGTYRGWFGAANYVYNGVSNQPLGSSIKALGVGFNFNNPSGIATVNPRVRVISYVGAENGGGASRGDTGTLEMNVTLGVQSNAFIFPQSVQQGISYLAQLRSLSAIDPAGAGAGPLEITYNTNTYAAPNLIGTNGENLGQLAAAEAVTTDLAAAGRSAYLVEVHNPSDAPLPFEMVALSGFYGGMIASAVYGERAH